MDWEPSLTAGRWENGSAGEGQRLLLALRIARGDVLPKERISGWAGRLIRDLCVAHTALRARPADRAALYDVCMTIHFHRHHLMGIFADVDMGARRRVGPEQIKN